MSPRRHRRAPQRFREHPGTVHGGTSIEDGPDGRWQVRAVPGGSSTKTYRCPGCDQEIPPGTAHVVAWDTDSDGDSRRHWHAPCWRARHRRGPRIPRRR